MPVAVNARAKAEEEALARSVFRRRWLNALRRRGVVSVGQLRAMSEEQLREIPNVGPKSVADLSGALADPTLREQDPLERLGPPQARLMSERDRELVRMRRSGGRIADIAPRFGISSVRVRQILDRYGCP